MNSKITPCLLLMTILIHSMSIKADNTSQEAEKMVFISDVKTLMQRLSDTDSINFFTKLRLRHEMNILMKQFSSFHSGEENIDLDQLRADFNRLYFKIQSGVKDGDPDLSEDLTVSKSGLWKALVSRESFSKLNEPSI